VTGWRVVGLLGSDDAAAIRPAVRASRPGVSFRWLRFLRAGSLALVVIPGLVTPVGAGEAGAAKAPLAIESLLLGGAVAGSRLVVVGERGHILVSTDDGANWTQAAVPTRVLLTAVHMHDERTGWAVGHDAVILRTVDGGETWTLVHQAPEEELPLLDVWFRDERSGFAVGAYGYFLATEDGGETWAPQSISEDDFHLNALVPVADAEARTEILEPDRTGTHQPENRTARTETRGTGLEPKRTGSQRLYIAAEGGVAYRSDDGGKTWRELPSPYAGSWFGGLALDENRVLLAGLRGHLFRSEDGGKTWMEVATRTQATLTGAIRLPSGSIVITGLEGNVLTSGDGGHSVSARRLPARKGISAALPLADGDVLLIGEFGVERLAQGE